MAITAGQDILASDFVSSAAGAGDNGKVAKLDANGKILDAFTYKQYFSMTAGADIAANDAVYITAANTVRPHYPTAQGTGAAISTSPSHVNTAVRSFQLSTNGLYIRFTGGDKDTAANLYGQVRTMNAAETDFANGTEATIFSTSSGVYWYDIAKINTDKFLIIFQAAGGSAGIKAVVVTVSGTTITVGSVQAIETTGNNSSWVSVAKIDTDKGLISYVKDSDGDLYCQVLTVSGTTITTNTPVLIKVSTGSMRVVSTQLTTNKVLVVYNWSGNLFGRTIDISGTTPTVNAEQTIDTGATNYMIGVAAISATKAIIVFGDDGGGAFNDKTGHLAISGSTITLSSTINLSSARITRYFGFSFIGTKYCLLAEMASTSSTVVWFLDISGSAPSNIASQSLSMGTTSNLYHGLGLCKVAPWTYVLDAIQNDGDYIIKMTPSSTLLIGVAPSAIASAATGIINHRYRTHTLSGITLTPGSRYYVDDTGQITEGSSLTAPSVGIAVNTTDILVQ